MPGAQNTGWRSPSPRGVLVPQGDGHTQQGDGRCQVPEPARECFPDGGSGLYTEIKKLHWRSPGEGCWDVLTGEGTECAGPRQAENKQDSWSFGSKLLVLSLTDASRAEGGGRVWRKGWSDKPGNRSKHQLPSAKKDPGESGPQEAPSPLT